MRPRQQSFSRPSRARRRQSIDIAELWGLTPLAIAHLRHLFLHDDRFLLASARLSDYVGRKPMILTALGLNAVALFCFVAESGRGSVAAQCKGRGRASRWRHWRGPDRYLAEMGRHAQRRDGVLRSRAGVAHLSLYRRLCALANPSGLCRAACRHARCRRSCLAWITESDEAQTHRAESRGRSDGAAVPADPLRLGAGRILPLVDALAHHRGNWESARRSPAPPSSRR